MVLEQSLKEWESWYWQDYVAKHDPTMTWYDSTSVFAQAVSSNADVLPMLMVQAGPNDQPAVVASKPDTSASSASQPLAPTVENEKSVDVHALCQQCKQLHTEVDKLSQQMGRCQLQISNLVGCELNSRLHEVESKVYDALYEQLSQELIGELPTVIQEHCAETGFTIWADRVQELEQQVETHEKNIKDNLTLLMAIQQVVIKTGSKT